MAQTALELIYNWWVVEKKQLIIGKDSEMINAASKIRLLLSQIGINSEIPKSFKSLTVFLSEEDSIKDAPDVIVQIRNSIVHSQENKRRKLAKISKDIKYEALQLCVWYIELALLRILDYKGIYFNRCSEATFKVDAEEKVPWIK